MLLAASVESKKQKLHQVAPECTPDLLVGKKMGIVQSKARRKMVQIVSVVQPHLEWVRDSHVEHTQLVVDNDFA